MAIAQKMTRKSLLNVRGTNSKTHSKDNKRVVNAIDIVGLTEPSPNVLDAEHFDKHTISTGTYRSQLRVF